jgi:hypothetical protein
MSNNMPYVMELKKGGTSWPSRGALWQVRNTTSLSNFSTYKNGSGEICKCIAEQSTAEINLIWNLFLEVPSPRSTDNTSLRLCSCLSFLYLRDTLFQVDLEHNIVHQTNYCLFSLR